MASKSDIQQSARHALYDYVPEAIYTGIEYGHPRGDAGVSVFVYWCYDGIRARIIRRCRIRVVCPGLMMDRVVRTEAIVRFSSVFQIYSYK